MRYPILALALASAALPAVAQAQAQVAVPAATGTLVEVSATGKVERVPDLAIISAGVETRAQTAVAAIADNANRMEKVRAALRKAGIADKDIQTSSINLNPDYRYDNNQPPVLTGYRASNSVSVKFRDIRNAGAILDALVAQGANSINGPSLTIDKPEAAMDEARVKALAEGRARAELYARALGKRVVRIVSISESGGGYPRPPMPMAMMAKAERGADASTSIDPGSQEVSVTLGLLFELQ